MNKKYVNQNLTMTVIFAGCMFALSLFIAGCATTQRSGLKESPKKNMTAKFSSTPVKVDGVLDDALWKGAIAYPFYAYTAEGSSAVREGGEAKLAWDNAYLYLAVKLTDSDVVAEGEEDQLHHYRMGDVAEIFLKPVDKTWWWELHVTPGNRKTAYFVPGRGRFLGSCTNYHCGMKVAAKIEGTLNNWEDRDNYWTAEMAIPIKDLAARGDSFGPGSRWVVLVARYNYSVYLPTKELTTALPLQKTSEGFSAYEYWAEIRFEK